MSETRTITYQGGAERVGQLVQMLEAEGVQVEYTPPEEDRGLAADLNQVAVSLVSSGSLLAITTAVKKFRDRVPRAKVKIEDEESDGGDTSES